MCHAHRFRWKVLEERDLEPVMIKMREQLMSRNVASEVANDITASVQATLLDQKLKSFTRCAHYNMNYGWSAPIAGLRIMFPTVDISRIM